MKELWDYLRAQWMLLAGIVVVAAVFVFTSRFIQPPPPTHITFAGGEEGGTYAYFAKRYAEELKKEKIYVDVLTTNGSGGNIAALEKPGGADVGFVQSGTIGMGDIKTPLRAVGAVYYEPLWLFYPKAKMVSGLRELKGRRLAVGVPGSGTRTLCEQLLAWNGVTAENSTFIAIPMAEADKALAENKVDAVFFIGSTENPVVRRLSQLPGVTLHSFNDAYSYVRKFGFLSSLLVPEGVLDMATHSPERNTTLLAAAAMLVTRPDLDSSVIFLLLSKAKEIHGKHGLLQDAGMFPNGRVTGIPLHEESRRYFQSGPSFLQRFLPYPVAAFFDRTKIMLLPILTLLIPLIRLAPPMYGWSMRRRVWRWYKALFVIEKESRAGSVPKQELLKKIDSIEEKVTHLRVPAAYAADLFLLRDHIRLVRKQVEAEKE